MSEIFWRRNDHRDSHTGTADGIAGHFHIDLLVDGWVARYVSTQLSRNKAKAKTLTRHTKIRRRLDSRHSAADWCDRWIERGDCDRVPEPSANSESIPEFGKPTAAEKQAVLDTIARIHRERGEA